MFDIKDRIELYTWIYADKLMAWIVRKFETVPPRTWDAICKQTWYFNNRADAQRKLGVEIRLTSDGKNLISRITKQVGD